MEIIKVSDRTFRSYLGRDRIQEEVARVAREISKDMADVERPLFVCVLNGAFVFASDLFRQLTLPDAEITFIRMKSYEGTRTTGKVKAIVGLIESVVDRDVVIVEDIVDSGYTMKRLISQLGDLGARSIKVCCLLKKPKAIKVPDLRKQDQRPLKEDAKRLLAADPTITISEVALKCGYEDMAYFSRAFKQATGQTPTLYRKTC